MKLLCSKKGYTLIELLTVMAILIVVASFTFSVFFELNKISDNRVDQSRIVIYNKAFEDFRFTDYSTLQSTPDDHVVVVEGGKIKINQYFNLSGEDANALANSGKGRYPQTKRECVAVIRAYCGTNQILPFPAAGISYSYFYHVSEGKCYVKAISDVDPSDSDWINLNEYYTLITEYKLGDPNNDGIINDQDAEVVRKIINNPTDSTTDAYLLKCADVNQDGLYTMADYNLLTSLINEHKTQELVWE